VRCLREDISARTRDAKSGAAASNSAQEGIDLILRLDRD
jgi:hypothetical protein